MDPSDTRQDLSLSTKLMGGGRMRAQTFGRSSVCVEGQKFELGISMELITTNNEGLADPLLGPTWSGSHSDLQDQQQISTTEVDHHAVTANNDDDDEDDDEEEKLVPAFSHYREIAMFWCCQLRYPIIVCIGNIISLGVAFHVLAKSIEQRRPAYQLRLDLEDFGGDGNRTEQIRMIKQHVGFALLILTFLVDCWIFFKGAKRIEQQVLRTQTNRQGTTSLIVTIPGGLDNLENPESTEGDHLASVDFVALSKSVDLSFGCCISGTPNATFIVSLLYALFSLTAWLAMLSGTSLFLLHALPNIDNNNVVRCLYRPFSLDDPFHTPNQQDEPKYTIGFEFLQESSEFPNLPTDVEAWIENGTRNEKKFGNTFYPGHAATNYQQQPPYLLLTDGSMILPFSHGKRRGIVVHSTNGSALEYPQSTRYQYLRPLVFLVGFPKEQPYDAFCGVFGILGAGTAIDEVLCQNKTGFVRRFEAVAMTILDSRVFGPLIYSSADVLWVVKGRQSFLPSRRYDSHSKTWRGEASISLVSYNISSMERTVVVLRNETNEFNYDDEKEDGRPTLQAHCRDWGWIMVRVSLTSLGSLFIFLYLLGVPSCSVPLCGTFTMFLHSTSLSKVWVNGAVFFVICMCIYVLKKAKQLSQRRPDATWKEYTLAWALYSLLASSLFPFWINVLTPTQFDVRPWLLEYIIRRRLLLVTPTIVLGLVVALILNHPVFEMMGFCSAMVAAFSMCLFAINYDPVTLVFPPVLLILSLGCFQAGGILRRYRLHIIVFARRGWRLCCHFIDEAAAL